MRKRTLLFGALILSLTACKKEGCTDAAATNYDEKAKKDDGSCIYPVDERDQYMGSYLVKDSVYQPGPNPTWAVGQEYILQISKGNTVKDTIFINNAGNYGAKKTAILVGSHFVIEANSGDSQYIGSGSGSFEGNKINYSMRSYVPGPTPNIYGKGSKQ